MLNSRDSPTLTSARLRRQGAVLSAGMALFSCALQWFIHPIHRIKENGTQCVPFSFIAGRGFEPPVENGFASQISRFRAGASTHLKLLIFSLLALPSSATGGGRARSMIALGSRIVAVRRNHRLLLRLLALCRQPLRKGYSILFDSVASYSPDIPPQAAEVGLITETEWSYLFHDKNKSRCVAPAIVLCCAS